MYRVIRICNCKVNLFQSVEKLSLETVSMEQINLGMSSEDACKGDSLDYLSREGVSISRGGARDHL
jgi:hypothetical protein